MIDKIRLFIIECVDPMDLLQERSEATALEKICKAIGHEVAILRAFCEQDLVKYLDYISSIDGNYAAANHSRVPLCIHISAHGNASGISFGRDFLNWHRLFLALSPILKDMSQYNGEVLISISACGAGQQKLVDEIEAEIARYHVDSDASNPHVEPPEYIFVTEGSQGKDVVYWDDATVSWTIFYHQISKLKAINDEGIHLILDDIEHATKTLLRSFKWDTKTQKYVVY
ncbi:hypothetical protein A1OW_14100 [Enterovibrio norvegicus]|uniref:Peptidase C80 domain-containing protein n=1 Tax=Enterovibrio norvegicus TaxID=188144 RepID=A0ABV4L661_9GAMM|nr:hypothetical protein [Enterovibrio norvegicus]OEF48847.1 hypothetical protein A1OW_14100 [Enterovibrio norvegicus]OEF53851.1 hypothetical protein A1OU_01785 [Enterovibrio norvegicus]PMI34209.1 hypothetical protein BCU47_07185 [Enterovibrio norvegicus]